MGDHADLRERFKIVLCDIIKRYHIDRAILGVSHAIPSIVHTPKDKRSFRYSQFLDSSMEASRFNLIHYNTSIPFLGKEESAVKAAM